MVGVGDERPRLLGGCEPGGFELGAPSVTRVVVQVQLSQISKRSHSARFGSVPVPSNTTDLPLAAITSLTLHCAPIPDVRLPDAATIVHVGQLALTLKVIATLASVLPVVHGDGFVTVTHEATSAGMVAAGLAHAVPVSVHPALPTVGPLEQLELLAVNSIW